MAFKILSVDGGGIRGIIPALVLAAIEERMNRPIYELFDLLAGTSTGGIVVLGLTKPGADGKVERSAGDLVRLYSDEGSTIFPTSLRQELHVAAIRGSKYPSTGIDLTLLKYFGETRLKDALKPVLVPSYDIEKQVPIFFKSEYAKSNAAYDFLMRDVARATSAAPTYFEPTKISTTEPLDYYALVDGGMVAGNPAMCAYAEAVKMGRIDADGVLMVSFGTGESKHPLLYANACKWGQLEWAQPIIDIVMQGSNATVDYQLQQLVPHSGTQQRYFRFQVESSLASGGMDDASGANLKALHDVTEDFLGHVDVKDALDRVCGQLTA